MNKKHYYTGVVIFITVLLFSSTLIFAHSGRTDEYGGHYDNDTGEYHYHHGFPAHDHPDGVCPYTIGEPTNWEDLIDKSSSGTAKITKDKDEYEDEENDIKYSNLDSDNDSDDDSDNKFINFFFNHPLLTAITFVYIIPFLIVYLREHIETKKNKPKD